MLRRAGAFVRRQSTGTPKLHLGRYPATARLLALTQPRDDVAIGTVDGAEFDRIAWQQF